MQLMVQQYIMVKSGILLPIKKIKMNSCSYKVFLLSLFLLVLKCSVYGQFKSHISVVIQDVQYESGLLSVKYEILNAKELDKIRVWIDVFKSGKDTIKARSWQGDVNKILTGKGQKTATWDLFKDNIHIIDSISLKISATIENRFYLDDPIVVSTIFPGWGDYKIKARKPYWIYGAVGYSLAGASAGMYFNARDKYNDYLSAKSISDKNRYFEKAVFSKNLSYAFLGAAGVIWAMDYLSLIKRKKEIQQMWRKNSPIIENPNIPSFKIVSSISNKIFVNTRLTKLQIVDGSLKYKDLDENACLDAFEEGNIQFLLFNRGPARAVNFYAKITSQDQNPNLRFPDSVLVGPIGLNQSRLVEIPVKAGKDIDNGSLSFDIQVSAQYNYPVNPLSISIPTRSFIYKDQISENELIADINASIPVLPVDGRERFALIIGNEGYSNEYTGLSQNFNVPFARNDALAFRKYAIQVLGVKEQNVILLLDAKRKEMSENILVLSDRVKQLKNSAELIFYFAGHGLTDTISTAPYLIPIDIAPANISHGISLDSLYKRIADSKSVRSLVVIDAAFNNSGRIMGLRGPSAGKIPNRPEVIPTNTVVFTAVWKFADIYMSNDKRHGLFTYTFLKTLKESRGKLSFLELDNKVNDELLSYTKNPKENRAITTYFSKDISDIWPKWMVR